MTFYQKYEEKEEKKDEVLLCVVCKKRPAEVRCHFRECGYPLCLKCAVPVKKTDYCEDLPRNTYYCPGTDCAYQEMECCQQDMLMEKWVSEYFD